MQPNPACAITRKHKPHNGVQEKTMEHNWRNKFSVMIETEIQAREITQEAFAELVGVDPATISRLLNGKQERVQGSTLRRFAEVMNRPEAMLSEAMRLPAYNNRLTAVPYEEKQRIPGMRVLIPANDVQKRVCDLAHEIEDYYQGREFVLVGVLNGAWMFLADLARQISSDNFMIDFVRISRTKGEANYAALAGSMPPPLIQDIANDVEGKEVLIVEDIADTGVTLDVIIKHILTKNPKDVKVCALLDKASRRKEELKDIKIDFRGFPIQDVWVVGYGLDDRERYRNLSDILFMDDVAGKP